MKVTVVNIDTLNKGDIFSWSLNMKKKCVYLGYDPCLMMCVYDEVETGYRGYSLPKKTVCISNS